MWNGPEIQIGMGVLSADGKTLGRVKRIYPEAEIFRVDCPRAPDLYVPVTSIRSVADDTVTLDANGDRVPYLGWELKPESIRNSR